jgi:hypothetical protein
MKADPLYTASAQTPELVTIPAFLFFMIDGCGEPGGPEFQDALGTLYGASHAVTSALGKTRTMQDRVKPLEGLWWCEGLDEFDLEQRDAWRWTLMIRQPDVVTPAMLNGVIEELAERRGRTPALAKIRLDKYSEGRAVQMLHIGPYSAEARTLETMRDFIAAAGLMNAGKQHEIYLSDPRRTAAENRKTILRQPVKKAAKTRAATA